MPRILIPLTLLMLPLGVSMGTDEPAEECRIEKVNYLGWETLRLSNGIITLHIVPRIGGRVIQLELGEHAYFAIHPQWKGKVIPPEQNRFGMPWTNYGGDKIWPAPQGWQDDQQWPGPPDPVFDAGPYTAEILVESPEEAAVRLTSGKDEYTGLQMGRTIRIFRGSSRVVVESFMKNVSRRPVEWSIWEVTQLDTASSEPSGGYEEDFWAYCPVNPDSRFPRGFNTMFGLVNHPAFSVDDSGSLFRVHYRYQVGKVGLDSTAGWLAAVNRTQRYAFFETFAFQRGARYPDGASVEFWLHGPGDFINNREIVSMPADPQQTPYLMETEVLSPLVRLEPGEDYRFELSWYAGRTGGPISEVTAAGAVHQPLHLSRQGARHRLEGRFAVFYKGQATATFYSAAGERLAALDLGSVTPGEEFILKKDVALPENAYRVSVHVRDVQGDDRGLLAELILAQELR